MSEGRAVSEDQVLELKLSCQAKCPRCALTGGTLAMDWNPYQISRCRFFNLPDVESSAAAQVLLPLCHDQHGAKSYGELCQSCLRCAGQADLHLIVLQPGVALPLLAQVLLLCDSKFLFFVCVL